MILGISPDSSLWKAAAKGVFEQAAVQWPGWKTETTKFIDGRLWVNSSKWTGKLSNRKLWIPWGRQPWTATLWTKRACSGTLRGFSSPSLCSVDFLFILLVLRQVVVFVFYDGFPSIRRLLSLSKNIPRSRDCLTFRRYFALAHRRHRPRLLGQICWLYIALRCFSS